MSVLVWYAAFQPRPYEEAFRAAIEDDGYNGAREAYTGLRANPFYRSRATELMQEFWEQRALRYTLDGKRDESLLCYLKGIELKDDETTRRQVGNLVGPDYGRLRFTLRHADAVRAMAFSPNGRVLATGSLNAARLWDANSGNPLASPLQHEDFIVAVTFSPDSQTIATGSGDRTARLWDVHSGKPRPSVPLPHEDRVNALAFSPDGRTFATGAGNPGGRGGAARLWDVRSGKPLTITLKHESSVNALAFSPSGRTFATGSGSFGVGSKDRSGTTRLWETRTGMPLSPPLRDRGVVMALAFNHDGRRLEVGSTAVITILQSRTGSPFASFLRYEDITSSMISWPNVRTFAVWTLGNSGARLWYAQAKKFPALSLQVLESVVAMAFNPNGRTFATGSMDKTARVWDTQAEDAPAFTFRYEVVGDLVAFSPNGRTFATGSMDKAVRLWDAHTLKPLSFPLRIENAVSAMAFSPDGRTFATVSNDNTARLWDLHTGKPLAWIPTLAH